MSANLLEWIIVWVFFLLVIGFMFAEAFWLNGKGWASVGKSLAFSALSNFIGFSIGLFVFFVVLAIFMMLSLDGTLDRTLKNSSINETVAILILISAAFLTPILLIICKRVFLSILKIQTGKPAWVYALKSSILIFAVSLGIPILIGYFTFR